MEQIEKSDEALAARIQDLVFVFDNLTDVDDRGMQELLRAGAGEKLMLAHEGGRRHAEGEVLQEHVGTRRPR